MSILIHGLTTIIILLVIGKCFSYSERKSDMMQNENIVYVSYYYLMGGVVIEAFLVVIVVIFILAPVIVIESEVWLYLGISLFLFSMLSGWISFFWQINWKIYYDDTGFCYRTILRRKYYFSYEDVEKIIRKKNYIILTVSGKKKIRINRNDTEHAEAFLIKMEKYKRNKISCSVIRKQVKKR